METTDIAKVIETLLMMLGALGTFLTLLATLLPKDSAITKWIARFGADLKGVNGPKLPPFPDDESKDPPGGGGIAGGTPLRPA